MNQFTRLSILGLYTIALDMLSQEYPQHRYFVLLFGVYAYELLSQQKNNIDKQ